MESSWEILEVDGRRVGNTTRLIDFLIQDLFNTGMCVVADHYKNGNSSETNRWLLKKVLKRLKLEHEWVDIDVIDGSIPKIKLKE